MLINSKTSDKFAKALAAGGDVYCGGLFLSARWFVFSQVAHTGLHMIILPEKEAAEYCSADLYHLQENDNVFFLPSSGKSIERSNYNSSLCVQRTAAIEKISGNKKDFSIIVTYPEALAEMVVSKKNLDSKTLVLEKDQTISVSEIEKTLQEAKAKADAAMKGIKTAVTVEFKTETQAIMKMDMKVNEEALKQAGVNWAKRKALRAILAIAPSSEKTTYVVKGNLVIMSPTDEPDTLRISNDGKYLYGKFDKDFEVKLTRTK